MRLFKTKYRIVGGSYGNYTVQHKQWWLPIWLETHICNAHDTIEQAEEFIDLCEKPIYV